MAGTASSSISNSEERPVPAVSEIQPATLASPSRPRIWRSVLRLISKGIALILTMFLGGLAIVLFVPDLNDYALATRDKHNRLAANASRKIVFVGGSNLAYGLHSQPIEAACGAHVVNMGMNGFLGMRFMLEEVAQDLKPSDAVVISTEYDSFYKSADGTGWDLLMILKARPASLRYLTLRQLWDVALAIPAAAQPKLLRTLRQAIQIAKSSIRKGTGVHAPATAPEDMDESDLTLFIEKHAGFNEYGDLTSHFGVKWPFEREQGLDITTTPIDPGVIDAIRSFSERMKQRGVEVYLAPSPVIQPFYERHKDGIQKLHTVLAEALPGHILSHPHRYMFAENLHFDTVFHLTKEGGDIRTARMIEDLRTHAGAACPASNPEALIRAGR